jgi:hypothetical protein
MTCGRGELPYRDPRFDFGGEAVGQQILPRRKPLFSFHPFIEAEALKSLIGTDIFWSEHADYVHDQCCCRATTNPAGIPNRLIILED